MNEQTHTTAGARLAGIRSGMREHLLRSPVCDTTRLAREMESVFERVLETA